MRQTALTDVSGPLSYFYMTKEEVKKKYINGKMADDMIAAMLGNGYSYHKFVSERYERLARWLWGIED